VLVTKHLKILIRIGPFLLLQVHPAFMNRVQAQAEPKAGVARVSESGQLVRFEKQVEELRERLRVPGLSAVIVKDQTVLWARGFGYADLEKRVPATPETLYHIASLTKTFAATLIMQLVEQHKLDLNEPVSKYSSDFKDDAVKIKHLLSHTSEGTPGEQYQYNGNRYDYLTAVIEKVTGKSFRQLAVKTILDPLGMTSSVPGHDVVDQPDEWSGQLGGVNLNRYKENLMRLALSYRLYGDGEIIRTPYPPRGIGAAAGLLSTVLDMARYDAAIDRHTFLKKETQDKAWTAFVSNGGTPLPHGLGWFAEDYHGLKLIWHYGYWPDSFSATYLKIPEKNLSLIVLANSDALSAPFYYTGGIESNVIACSFLRLFVFESLQGHPLPDPIWKQSTQEFSARLSGAGKQPDNYAYDCAVLSHTAMSKWLEDRRAQARTPIKADSRLLETYLGRYGLDSGRIVTVSRDGDRLTVDLPSKSFNSEMFPESRSRFFLKVADLQVTFVQDEKGQVTDLEIDAGGKTFRAKKVR
jgi:CubicO group peptidase (beta-lactamase class C family)